MVPIVPEYNIIMTLPSGGSLFSSLRAPAEEVLAILESKRKDVLQSKGPNQSEEEAVLLQMG